MLRIARIPGGRRTTTVSPQCPSSDLTRRPPLGRLLVSFTPSRVPPRRAIRSSKIRGSADGRVTARVTGSPPTGYRSTELLTRCRTSLPVSSPPSLECYGNDMTMTKAASPRQLARTEGPSIYLPSDEPWPLFCSDFSAPARSNQSRAGNCLLGKVSSSIPSQSVLSEARSRHPSQASLARSRAGTLDVLA